MLCFNHTANCFLYLFVDGCALAGGGAVCGGNGDWLTASLFCQGEELAEHQFTGGASEFVDIGGGEVGGGDGGQDYSGRLFSIVFSFE